jgi:uncharacterized protein
LVTRYIRRTAKSGAGQFITPLFLGGLTVLIPCGVTQAMMALAIGTGNPFEGAAIMAAFTLGSSPLFFGLAYLATQLGQRLEGGFMQIVALIVFVLGLVSIDGGLALLGAPFTVTRATNVMTAPALPPQAQPNLPAQPAPQTLTDPAMAPAQPQPTPFANPAQVGPQVAPGNVVNINVLDYGYNPPISRAKAGQPVQLNLITSKTYGCTLAFVIPALNLSQLLPETGATTLELPPQPAGSVLYYTCSMGMFGGQIEFSN